MSRFETCSYVKNVHVSKRVFEISSNQEKIVKFQNVQIFLKK
jgi:hypothetical protein